LWRSRRAVENRATQSQAKPWPEMKMIAAVKARLSRRLPAVRPFTE
jgi:hypothetical protein